MFRWITTYFYNTYYWAPNISTLTQIVISIEDFPDVATYVKSKIKRNTTKLGHI